MTLINDLIAVREMLAEQGRSVGCGRHEGKMCLYVAIGDVMPDGIELDRLRAMVNALVAHMPEEFLATMGPVDSVIAFNDGTTDDQVVFDVIEKALADLGGLT